MHIGSLGTKRVTFKHDFEWFGATLTVNTRFSPLDMIDFLETAGVIDENDQAASMRAVKNLFRTIVADEDFEEFWQLAKDNGQTVEDLIETYQAVASAVAKRPFGPDSESSDGPAPSARESLAVSSSQDSELGARVTKRLEAQRRPDLANVVDIASAARVV